MRQVQTGKKHTVDPADRGAANDGNNQQQNRIVHVLVNQHTSVAQAANVAFALPTDRSMPAGDQAEQHTVIPVLNEVCLRTDIMLNT